MYVHVRAVPKAKREEVIRHSDTEFEIRVRESAERNMANGRIRTLLANALCVNESAIRMLTGHRSHSKMYTVDEGSL